MRLPQKTAIEFILTKFASILMMPLLSGILLIGRFHLALDFFNLSLIFLIIAVGFLIGFLTKQNE